MKRSPWKRLLVVACALAAAMCGPGLAADEAAAERLKSIETLAQGDQAALTQAMPALIEAINDENADVRAAAAQGLGRLGAAAQAAVPALVERLGDETVTSTGAPVWWFAMRALAEIGPEALPALTAAMDDARPAVARGAIGALYGLGERARPAVPAIVAHLEKDNEHTRLVLVQALQGIGHGAAPAVPTLIKLLGHDDFHTRYWSAQALGAIGPEAKEATDALIARTKDDVVSVRRHSVAALGMIGPAIGEEGLAALTAALRDPLEPVRENAATALGRLGPFAAPAVDALRKVAEDKKIAARVVAARAVWQITGDREWPTKILVEELADLTWADRALAALVEMGQAKTARDQLVTLLQSPDPFQRLTAAETLGLLGPEGRAAVPALEQAGNDTNADVRQAAATSLKQIRGQSP